MVAGPGGDERLGHVGSGHPGGAFAGGAGGGFLGVDDHGGQVEPGADLAGHRAQAGFGLGFHAEAEDGEYLLGLLEVQSEGDAAELLEFRDGLERIDQVGGGALLRVGQVEEEDPPRFDGDLRQDVLDEVHEHAREVRNHRPVHHCDEIGGPEGGAIPVRAHDGGDLLRGDLVEAAHHAQHQLAIGELDRGGDGGVAERDHLGPGGHVGEDRMDGRLAEGADVGDPRALGEQGIGHDGAVAAEFVHAGVKLEIGALARGGRDAPAELGNRRNGREIVALTGALGDRGHDGVHKAVEAHEGVLAGAVGAVFAQLLQGAGLEIHGKGAQRKFKRRRPQTESRASGGIFR